MSELIQKKKTFCNDLPCISTVSRLLIHVGCPDGFKLIPGRIPGWGQIGTESIEDTIFDCSDKCNGLQNCCSFEYSQTEGWCDLNMDCLPTHGVYEDYSFCSKGNSFSFLC